MRGTYSSPIPIDDSEDEVVEELCNPSADSSVTEDLSVRLADPPLLETYAFTSQKRKRDEVRTDYSDAFIQGSSSVPMTPPGEGKKARKRRRKMMRQALEANDMLSKSRHQQKWYNQMSSVLYGPSSWADPTANNLNVDLNASMLMGPGSTLVYPADGEAMRSYVPVDSANSSNWVSAMALAGSLPDQNAFSNQYQWPPPVNHPSFPNNPPLPNNPSSLSHSKSPPALLERVTSPLTAPALWSHNHANTNTSKRLVQTIGMKPDNEPHSKHGVFRATPGNLSYFMPTANKKTGNVGTAGVSSFSYIPNPACTIVMEQLPKSRRTVEFVKEWANQASGVLPVCIFVDPPAAKALVEFPSAKSSRKAWESPRLGAEYAGLKPHELRGKPRVDLIRVWWYRVDGVGAGAGVGEIEEGEIEDDVVGDQEQQSGQAAQETQQELPRQQESKKARKARKAKERQEKQAAMMMAGPLRSRKPGLKQNQNGESSIVSVDSLTPGHGSSGHTSLGHPTSPLIGRSGNEAQLHRNDLNDDISDSRNVLSVRHARTPVRLENVSNTVGPASSPTSWHGRAEARSRRGPQPNDVPMDLDAYLNGDWRSIAPSGEPSLARQLTGPAHPTGVAANKRRSSLTPPMRETISGPVTSMFPTSPTSSNATTTILKTLDFTELASRQARHHSQGTSPMDITMPITGPLHSPVPSLLTTTSAIATSAAAAFRPSARSLSKVPASPRKRRSSVVAKAISELDRKTSILETRITSKPSQPVTNAAPSSNLTPTPSPISIFIPGLHESQTERPPDNAIPRGLSSSTAISGGSAASASVNLAELRRVLVERQKVLEEKIAKSKLEMSRVAGTVHEEPKETTPMITALSSDVAPAAARENKEMEDRLRKLVVQSQKSRSKSTDQQQSTSSPSRTSSSSSSASGSTGPSTLPSPSLLTPSSETLLHTTTSSVQNLSLEDLAVTFITETISTLKQSPSSAAGAPMASPVPCPPSSSESAFRPLSQIQDPQVPAQPQSQPQKQVRTLSLSNGNSNDNGYASIKEELAARQQQLEQYIAESKVLMTQLTLARTKQEKDRLLGLMREKTRLMDKEKEKMANANRVVVAAREQKQVTQQVAVLRWPCSSLDAGVLTISDDEYDEGEDDG